MATIAQKVTALEDFRDSQQRPWNKQTSDRIAELSRRIAALEAQTPVEPDVDPPPPAVRSMYLPVYGPAIGTDSRNNLRLGVDAKSVAYRFIASQSSPFASIAINQRGGPGYSLGNGGTIRAAITTDTGTELCVTYWMPGNRAGAWEEKEAHAFTGAPAAVAGQTYRIVLTNPDANPSANHVSVNFIYDATAPAQRQPGYTNDLAVLRDGTELRYDTPVFDLTYANGKHDGQGYFGLGVSTAGNRINGAAKVRQVFTPTAPHRITRAGFRAMRVGGSEPLTLTLMRGSTVVAGSSIAASQFTVVAPLPRDPATGSRWSEFTFPELTMAAGETWYLEASSAGTYYALASHEQDRNDADPDWGSPNLFSEGRGQFTTDGTTWQEIYAWAPVDLQCYLA